MPENTDNQNANTADEPVINTDANDSGTVTDTANMQAQAANNQATQTVDITKTQEFKDALTAAIKNKIPQLKRSIAQELTGEGEGKPTVEDLQKQLQDANAKSRIFEAKETVRDYLSDGKNKLQVRPENIRAVEKLVLAEVEYDDEGSISNLKEAVDSVKNLAPALFVTTTTQINGNQKGQSTAVDFNNDLRRAAGFQT